MSVDRHGTRGKKRKKTKRPKILHRKIKIDQPEPHRPQKKMTLNSGEVGESLEKIFNDEPIIQESGCKHAINR
jgi:hypothetical protein